MNDFRRLTVSQISEYIGMVFDSDMILSNVCISAEIADLKYYQSSGHMYFTLKDEQSVLKSVMFRSNVQKLRFTPKNGMNVLVYGRIGVYSKSGTYQLYVNSMSEDGKGKDAEAFERLKKKLAAEGLFDESRKRPIPRFPATVGVITSAKGAALQDILNVTGRRWPLADILICPSLVQGESAPAELCEAMRYFNTFGGADVLIIGRGGGSGEDLSAFNDEALARLIAASPIPVISAVGHQTDFTICDFVADKREPTPSAAAERATPDIEQIKTDLAKNGFSIANALNNKIGVLSQKLISQEKTVGKAAAEGYIAYKSLQIENFENVIEGQKNIYLSRSRSLIENYSMHLVGLNPLAVLQRGYSYVTDNEGNLVSDADDVKIGDKLSVRFEKTDLEVKVTDKNVINKPI
ncbi:MAG: exodeoxyribonuclease VII large subunit [Clostridia bacterium]|nr:exodeoxyribonuclease VII large subunit [Clostridia bacterium]